MIKYKITMKHDEKSLIALSHMQYNLFCKTNRILRSALSVGLMVYGVMNFSKWWGVLLIAYGWYLTSSTYAQANHTARKLSKQLKESGQSFPASEYLFEANRMRIISLPGRTELDPLPYSQAVSVGEDANAFYIFQNQHGGYMVPKEQLGDKTSEFRDFLQEKTGKKAFSSIPPIITLLSRLFGKKD